jgi:hypothetical protein
MIIRAGRGHDMERSMSVLSWAGRSRLKTWALQLTVRIIGAPEGQEPTEASRWPGYDGSLAMSHGTR